MGDRGDRRPAARAVRGYTGYRENATEPVQHRENPTGQVVLIVSFGDQLRTQAATAGGGGAGGGGSLRAYTSFVAGLHDTPATTAHDGRQHGIQIGLDPPAAFALLGVPMHEIVGGAVELRELLGRTADRWTDQLATTRTWADRFGVLDQLLGAQISAGPVASPEIRWAWAELRRSAGQVRIGDLAEQVGCSHRHLVACFREQIGVTPKTAARVLRFQHARHLLEAGQSPAAVAACCGYSDQSHLSREFTRLAGCTPAEFTRHRSGLSKIPATTPG